MIWDQYAGWRYAMDQSTTISFATTDALATIIGTKAAQSASSLARMIEHRKLTDLVPSGGMLHMFDESEP
jgi:hypothetical protein